MTKKILFTFVCCAFLASGMAQLKVNSLGKTWAGSVPSGHDPNNLITLSLYGPGGGGSGAKLSFGNFGSSTTGRNVFIGEYSDNVDSDQLWLHGKKGFVLTRGSNPMDLLAYCFSETADAFYIATKVYSKGVLLNSDARFKSNVVQIQTPLKRLLLLNGVNYDFDFTPKIEKLHEKLIKDNSYSSEMENDIPIAEEKRIGQVNSENTNITPQIETRIGFIAQDLQKIFPDLVEEDDMGFLAVDYIGLIPVIVEAMKEQQTQIEELKEQNKQLVKLINIKSIDEKAFQENGIESIPLLLQNTPNPFNQMTEIGYYIPETVNSANIYIYDINGFQQKNISISERGKGVTTLQASALQAGIYFYTLICDGNPVDTKQMILTR